MLVDPGCSQGDANELGLFNVDVGLLGDGVNLFKQLGGLGVLKPIRMLKAVKNALVLIKISGSQGGFKRRPICGMSDQCTVVVERFGMENDAKGVGE